MSLLRGLAVALAAASVAVPSAASAWDMRVCADPDYMPFSNADLGGYENKIAAILADELGATLSFEWTAQTPTMISEFLREGLCDVIVGVPDSQRGLLPSLAYYQSPYVFVSRADSPYDITSFDDEALKGLRLGVQATNDLPHTALGKRNLIDAVKLQFFSRPDDPRGPLAPLINAVAAGDIDVAIPWGPVGGYFAARAAVPLKVAPVPTFDIGFTPMYLSIVVAVRRGDEAYRDALNLAIANRWDDIEAVLADYNVPLIEMPRPVISLGEGN